MLFEVVAARCSSADECMFFFFQAEDGIRDLVRSRGLGDVYKRQGIVHLEDETIINLARKIIEESTHESIAHN